MRVLALLLFACADPVLDSKTEEDSADPATPPSLGLDVTSVDFGVQPYGEPVGTLLELRNDGGSALVLDPIVADAPFTVSPTSLTVQPAGVAQLSLSVQLEVYGAQMGTLTLSTNDPDAPTVTVSLLAKLDDDADDDGHTTTAAGGDDCDDNNSAIHPGAAEAWYDGVDADCAGNDDNDQDGDGWPAETDDSHPDRPDCVDTNPDIHPDAEEIPYDNVDGDCDGGDDYDMDGDGVRASGWGEDCDDFDAEILPGAAEVPDGVDNDCNGLSDDDAPFRSAGRVWASEGPYDQAGGASALVDLDGDGLAELVVGAACHGAESLREDGPGAFAVFLGAADLPATGTSIDAALLVTGTSADMGLGASLATPGDWDGDGLPDLAVQAVNAGAVHVISGASLLAGGTLADSLVTLSGADALGTTLTTRADLDGDGLGELIATFDGGSVDGVALVYGGAVGELDVADGATWLLDAGRSGENGVVGADLDGDGRDDLALGAADSAAAGVEGAGAVWILYGAAAPYEPADAAIVDTADWSLGLGGLSEDDGVGAAVQTGPDWDADGRAELWVSDREDGLYVVDGGVLSGGHPMDVATAGWTWDGDAPARLTRAGDWDDDGVPDMAAWFDDGAGKLAILGTTRRSGTEPASDDRLAWVIGSSSEGNSTAGIGLAAEGADVDGDGDDDLLTGDPGFDTNAGEAYVLLQR